MDLLRRQRQFETAGLLQHSHDPRLSRAGGSVSVDPTSPLRPQLEHIEEKLQDSIEEVCESPPVAKVNTGELIKIEESLSIATEAAKEAVSIRRKLRQDGRRGETELRPEA